MCGNLVKSYSSRALNYQKRIFNYKLSRARRYVECAFGILTAKWHIFTTTIQQHAEAVDEVIKDCIVLHNFVLDKEPLQIEEHDMQDTLPSIAMTSVRSTRAVNQMQDQSAEYFISRSVWLEWQDNMV